MPISHIAVPKQIKIDMVVSCLRLMINEFSKENLNLHFYPFDLRKSLLQNENEAKIYTYHKLEKYVVVFF